MIIEFLNNEQSILVITIQWSAPRKENLFVGGLLVLFGSNDLLFLWHVSTDFLITVEEG